MIRAPYGGPSLESASAQGHEKTAGRVETQAGQRRSMDDAMIEVQGSQDVRCNKRRMARGGSLDHSLCLLRS
jgi:hypothetical protein